MGDRTEQNPYTRKDVLRLIKENGGTAKGLDLSGKVFEEGIDLAGLNLDSIILSKAMMTKACLRHARLVFAKLRGAFLLEADLQGADLTGAQLQDAELWFSNLQGIRLLRTQISQSTDFSDVNWGNYILSEEKEGLFAQAVATYQRLKVWYKNAGISDIEGEFLFREMSSKRKEFWWGDRKLFSLKGLFHPLKPVQLLRVIIPRKPLFWALLTAYGLLCGYGERLKRILIWVFLIVFGLALIYFVIGTLTPNTFLNSLYYSAVSFTALGYGSWAPQPTGWVKGLGAFEAFVGVFMMALFLVTFVRKMSR